MVRRFVGGISTAALQCAFMEWFGLQENQADLLVVLFERHGRPLSSQQLSVRLSSHRPLGVQAVYERIRVLRQAMEAESVDTNDRGYLLTDQGMAECRSALRAMAQALLRNGFELPHVDGLYEFEVGAGG
jgi:hypothetical protein